MIVRSGCRERLDLQTRRRLSRRCIVAVITSVAAAEPLLLMGDPRCEIPQRSSVSAVRLVEPAGADLGAGRTVQDLGGRRFRNVVEVAEDDEPALLALAVEQVPGAETDSTALVMPASRG